MSSLDTSKKSERLKRYPGALFTVLESEVGRTKKNPTWFTSPSPSSLYQVYIILKHTEVTEI